MLIHYKFINQEYLVQPISDGMRLFLPIFNKQEMRVLGVTISPKTHILSIGNIGIKGSDNIHHSSRVFQSFPAHLGAIPSGTIKSIK